MRKHQVNPIFKTIYKLTNLTPQKCQTPDTWAEESFQVKRAEEDRHLHAMYNP